MFFLHPGPECLPAFERDANRWNGNQLARYRRCTREQNIARHQIDHNNARSPILNSQCRFFGTVKVSGPLRRSGQPNIDQGDFAFEFLFQGGKIAFQPVAHVNDFALYVGFYGRVRQRYYRNFPEIVTFVRHNRQRNRVAHPGFHFKRLVTNFFESVRGQQIERIGFGTGTVRASCQAMTYPLRSIGQGFVGPAVFADFLVDAGKRLLQRKFFGVKGS